MKLEIPTTLSEAKNAEFRALYKKHYHIELTSEEANKEAFRLLTFCAIIIENTPKYHEN